MLKLQSEAAKAADNIASGIRESGKYIGVITRAEKLTSDKGTQGLGLSFRADNGQTADYLDLYHTKGDGEPLRGFKIVNAILCCAKLNEAADGTIACEKWKDGGRVKVTVPGYPALMGKRIGFLLQKVLETDQHGKDREKVEVFGVFNAETELTASEMYAKATNPARLTQMLDALMAKPVRDNRTKPAARSGSARPATGGADDPFGDDFDAPF